MPAADDDYYVEIRIEIDGWLWNLADAPRRGPRFPSAQKLLAEWERPPRKRRAA